MHVVRDEEPQGQGNVTEVEVKEQEETKAPVDFEFGDLCVGCSCGNVDVIAPGIEGIQLPTLPATDKHELILVCSKCKHSLKLFFKESENKEELRKKKEDYKAFVARVEAEAKEAKEKNEDERGIIEQA